MEGKHEHDHLHDHDHTHVMPMSMHTGMWNTVTNTAMTIPTIIIICMNTTMRMAARPRSSS